MTHGGPEEVADDADGRRADPSRGGGWTNRKIVSDGRKFWIRRWLTVEGEYLTGGGCYGRRLLTREVG